MLDRQDDHSTPIPTFRQQRQAKKRHRMQKIPSDAYHHQTPPVTSSVHTTAVPKEEDEYRDTELRFLTPWAEHESDKNNFTDPSFFIQNKNDGSDTFHFGSMKQVYDEMDIDEDTNQTHSTRKPVAFVSNEEMKKESDCEEPEDLLDLSQYGCQLVETDL